MALTRQKAKGRRSGGRFAGIPHRVMETSKFVSLDSHAIRLLLELAKQYNGHNNGDLSAPWSIMKKRGFRSSGTLNKSIKQLKDVGFIEVTRMGGRNTCNLYAVTWERIDSCGGKLDVIATITSHGTWKDEN